MKNNGSETREMKIAYEYSFSKPIEVSIVLLDWSVRESYHTLDYLNNQTVPREIYEVIWIEYYEKKPKDVEDKIKKYIDVGKPPVLNKWIIMNISRKIYYHKHLMYNIGIIISRGKIICFCDSDAVYRPTFVRSIISEFEKDKNIVLHLDEVRNINKKFYPFNYPTIEEIISSDCVNLIDGRPAGLIDKSDPLHIPNYGACMCALRDDLIAIGGADEDIDYLGHVCGPYDMTFRLVNFGKKEIWHQNEFLYHTWHPGQAGYVDYLGPHDGLRMSTLALESLKSGRVFPLVESHVIKALRTKDDIVSLDSLLSQSLQWEVIENWREEKIFNWKLKVWNSLFKKINLMKLVETNLFEEKGGNIVSFISYISKFIKINLQLYRIMFKMLLKQLSIRIRIKFMVDGYSKPIEYSFAIKLFKTLLKKSPKFLEFLITMFRYNIFIIAKCWGCFNKLDSYKHNTVNIFGTGSIAEILCVLSKYKSIKINAIYDEVENKGKFLRWNVLPIESLKNLDDCIIIASVVDIDNMRDTLRKIGIKDNKIITLG